MTIKPTTLLLVPTELERRLLDLDTGVLPANVHLMTCGFGPLSAALTTQLAIIGHRPERVILAGIAGTYDAALPLGDVYTVRRTRLEGIGIRHGNRLVAPAETGFDLSLPVTYEGLLTPSGINMCDLLVTVCEPSNTRPQAVERQELHPGAALEDMEGYGVAAACDRCQVPLMILRAISNIAGDRETTNWVVRPALQALRQSLLAFLEL